MFFFSVMNVSSEDFNFDTMAANMDPYVLVKYKSQERKSKVARG